jgi:hypothetical protein
MMYWSLLFFVDNRCHLDYEAEHLSGTPSVDRRGSTNMNTLNASGTSPYPRPYRSFKDDPRYDEIKRIILELPPEELEKLRICLVRWADAEASGVLGDG